MTQPTDPPRPTAVEPAAGPATAGPRLLRDPLTGRQVLIAAHRRHRPQGGSDDCPFCPGGQEAPEPYLVRSFPNRWPALPGRSEVVLYSPDHDRGLGDLSPVEVRRVVDLWAERTEALGRREDVGYVLVFENRGAEVGATVAHPHGQVFGLPVVPDLAAAELGAAGCVLCEQPVDPDLAVVRTPHWVGHVPEAAGWPYELRIAPVRHLPDLPSLGPADRDELAALLSDCVRRLDRVAGGSMPSMMWIHQRPPHGLWPTAHLHVHLVGLWHSPGRPRLVAAGEHGSGILVNPLDPRTAAAHLRGAGS
ncbi:hypothetical protein ACGF07_11255 [Kitasatospora sp. NPDC048194]|uniref:galactose-1-phosphate uridylyltransferase n=1 Tax=Kitasatospora sp. NPDC048194 TaxID=3364045 RepID=UPI003721EEA8